MMKIELEILGDPQYICQDVYTTLRKDGDDIYPQGYKGTYNERWGSFNAEQYQPLIKVNYRLPDEINLKEGKWVTLVAKKGIFDVEEKESGQANFSMGYSGVSGFQGGGGRDGIRLTSLVGNDCRYRCLGNAWDSWCAATRRRER